MPHRKVLRLAVALTATALVGAGAQQALASGGDNGSLVPSPASASLGAQRIVAVRESVASTTSSTTYVTLTSASVTIPSGQRGLMVAHFSGESLCGGTSGYCSLRILIDGTEMVPNSGTDFAFDSPGDSWESHAMERTWSGAAAGTHTFTLQRAVVGSASSFRLDDWVFDVQYWRQA